jgi:hypothetical protein
MAPLPQPQAPQLSSARDQGSLPRRAGLRLLFACSGWLSTARSGRRRQRLGCRWTSARAHEAAVPVAVDYGSNVQTLGFWCDVRGVPQLEVVGTQVSVPALVRPAREILDLSRSASGCASARDCTLCRKLDATCLLLLRWGG